MEACGVQEGATKTEGDGLISYKLSTALVRLDNEGNKRVKRTLPSSHARKREGKIELKFVGPFLRIFLRNRMVDPFLSLHPSRPPPRGMPMAVPLAPKRRPGSVQMGTVRLTV